jgi:hypothetical protein
MKSWTKIIYKQLEFLFNLEYLRLITLYGILLPFLYSNLSSVSFSLRIRGQKNKTFSDLPYVRTCGRHVDVAAVGLANKLLQNICIIYD